MTVFSLWEQFHHKTRSDPSCKNNGIENYNHNLLFYVAVLYFDGAFAKMANDFKAFIIDFSTKEKVAGEEKAFMRFTTLPTSFAKSGKAGTGFYLTNLDYLKELLKRITHQLEMLFETYIICVMLSGRHAGCLIKESI